MSLVFLREPFALAPWHSWQAEYGRTNPHCVIFRTFFSLGHPLKIPSRFPCGDLRFRFASFYCPVILEFAQRHQGNVANLMRVAQLLVFSSHDDDRRLLERVYRHSSRRLVNLTQA